MSAIHYARMPQSDAPKLEWVADFSLHASFGGGVNAETTRQVEDAHNAIMAAVVQGAPNHSLRIRAVTPAYASLLITFETEQFEPHACETMVQAALARALPRKRQNAQMVEIPVCYDAEFAIDLPTCAAFAGLSPVRFIERHAEAEYRVAFLGFTPGFPYLLGLPPELAISRLDAPRPRVAPGSVGIAGAQTGVYPFATPGGWRIVGRTPLRIFDARRNPPAHLAIGDRVRFVPISRDQFAQVVEHDA
ncbi:MAG: 5-oxoprolinase subunit PxpB [Phycisphaerales bacterium]|nr:5-oxoprolinase subunit PxpB [Phycisphaerales bacterium]